MDFVSMRKQGTLSRAAGLAGLVLLGLGHVALAQGPANDRPDNGGGRYVFHKAPGNDGAVLRLDRNSGQVSSCTKQDAGWACYAVADERAALEAEIARLQSENGRLKEAALAKSQPLPQRDSTKAPPVQNSAVDGRCKTASPLGDATIEIRGPGVDRIKEFASHAWQRMVEIFRNVQ